MTILFAALVALFEIVLAVASAVVIVGGVMLLTVVFYDRGIGDLLDEREKESTPPWKK